MMQKILLPVALLLGSSKAVNLGSEAMAMAALQAKLQELVEDEQLIDLSKFDKEEEFQTLLETDRDCEETGWKSYLMVGQQVEQMSSVESSMGQSKVLRERRESELKLNAKRAEQLLQDRLSRTQNLAVANGQTDQSVDFKQQMHQQIEKLNSILDEIEGEATHQMKYIQEKVRADPNVSLEAKQKRVLHIVPHSHTDDLSSNKDLQKSLSEQMSDGDLYTKGAPAGYMGNYEDILNSTLTELYADGNKTFTFGDLKFFKQWYDKLNATDKADVKTVIQNGQLDLVNGGWMPPDEALTQYDGLLDSFQIGQQFLWKEFEYQPRVSWQLDVNGVSQGYARLAKDVGFDMLIFSSVSEAEKENMRKKGTHSQIWRTSTKNFGKRKDVLAVTLDQGQSALNSYCWPKGFWADTNYLIDAPITLNKTQADYKFDDLVKSLYADITDRFDQEGISTHHLFQPFGCDMAYVDAKINYKIMDKLMVMWKELGFDKDVEIKYSTPTIFYQKMHDQNSRYLAMELRKNTTANETKNATKKGWTVRKDDTFPYQPQKTTYLNGYYSARPHLKKKVREFTQSFHSSLRLLAQQVLRKDLDDNKTAEVLQFQTGIMESLGNLQSYEAITGTSNQFLSGEYYSNAKTGKKNVIEMNQKLLADRLWYDYGIKVEKLESDMNFNFDNDDLTSSYSHDNKTLVIVQNPTQQKREQIVEIQVPYYNFTVEQVLNNSKTEKVKVEKYLPRVWQNSQKFFVPSLAQFKVTFDNPFELYKVFIVTGKGVIRQKNPVPFNYQFKFQAEPKIWNLNLPVFLPKNGWEISNFQQDFLNLLPNTTIAVGSKSLKFLEIVPKKKLKKAGAKKGSAGAKEADEGEKKESTSGESKNSGPKDPKPVDSANSTAPTDPIAEVQNATAASQNESTSSSAEASQQKMKKKKKTAVKPLGDENEGAAIFLYEDKATGVSQKFAFSLRYYVGENAIGEPLQKQNSTGLVQLDRRIESGVFSFATNKGESPAAQKSFRYGEINLKRSKRKSNNDSAEFLLVYEQKYAPPANNTPKESSKKTKVDDKFKDEEYTQKIRAHVRINLNKIDDFVQFHVSTNEVPISQDKTGKDIVVDWFLMDGFDTDEKFWVDSNGLQMVSKTLNKRKEYELTGQNTVSGNFYPITSAIAVRDFNKSMNSDASQRQVTIMTDRSQGASAGMRSRKNIEIMHQRRYRRSNSSRTSGDGLNDLDGKGRGLQVKETYYMQVTTVGHSKQRALQRQIDQPMLILYGQGYLAPTAFDSSKTTGLWGTLTAGSSATSNSTSSGMLMDLGVLEKISKRINENMKETDGMTPEQKSEKIDKGLKTNSEEKQMKAKGQSDEDFKGRKVDHQDQSIPDKIVEHYPGEQRKEAPDQQGKPKPKPKKKEKKKAEPEPVDTTPDSETNAVQLDESPKGKGDTKSTSAPIPFYKLNQEAMSLDSATFNKAAPAWFDKYNKEFKESSTLKLLVYGVQKNQVMIRLANLEDNFDGLTAKSYKFDINAWAREFYLEANTRYLAFGNTTTDILQGLRLNITEMNLAGSIPKSHFLNRTQAHTNWLQKGVDVETMDSPVNNKDVSSMTKIEKEPIDNVQFVEVDRAKGSVETLGALFEQNFIVTLEPQSIRTFSVQYFLPNLTA